MKNIIITGASKGIGAAIAWKFAEAGFDIALCARTLADLETLRNDILQKYPTIRVFIQAANVAEKAQIQAFGDAVLAEFGSIGVLVNNAGVFLPGAITKEEEDTLLQLMNTNLYSAYYLTRKILPTMLAQNDGYIFNMCSIASKVAYPTGGSYSVSKFALLGFNKALREELKTTKIRVTAILPGAVRTPAWGDIDLPDSRFIQASDIADAVWSCYNMTAGAVVEELLVRPQAGDI
jgi:NADP-dependent 3-hydroxy acid dehydrogenase YdfG